MDFFTVPTLTFGVLYCFLVIAHHRMRDYAEYFHEDRTHLGLAKQTPTGRVKETNPSASCQVVALPRLGGLHHRYQLAA